MNTKILKSILWMVMVTLVSWTVPCLAQAQWTTSGTNIYNANTGNVGIGTGATVPARKLHVAGGEGQFDGYRTFFRNKDAQLRFGNFSPEGTWVLGVTGDQTDDFFISDVKTNQTPFRFVSGAGLIYLAGNVGIGLTTATAPAQKLHVAGNILATGDIIANGNIAAKYQDVAEWVPTKERIAPGTVVSLDEENINHVKPAGRSYDTRVAGVVSAQPGVILGEQGENKVAVATTGRVKVKATTENGPIHIGDIMVTSDEHGRAMRSTPINVGEAEIHRPGTVLGKALEPLEKGEGEILLLLTLQ